MKLKEKAIGSQKVSMGKADRKALHVHAHNLVPALVHVHEQSSTVHRALFRKEKENYNNLDSLEK